jgi:hypothetical protein
MAGSGSIVPVFVVPAVATTQNGRRPAARSAPIARRSAAGSIRREASVGTTRTAVGGKPAMRAALVTQWWDWPVT